MTSTANLWDDLTWRGLLAITTDETELKHALNTTHITFYCGFDPTAPSLHLGNLVQLLLMRRLQNAGHHPIALIGGGTGLIGDPRPTAERQLNDLKTVQQWVEKLTTQVARFLPLDGTNPARIVNNHTWLSTINAIDFLRDIGKHFRVGTMLRKEAVSARLNSDAGISFTEFAYQILQGFDFLALNRDFGVTLQTGGSDQWGNLTAGTELIHKTDGTKVHAIASPLILNTDGTKFGKSEGNAIWLDPNLTTPFAFHQFWLNTADADVISRLKIFTFLTREEIEALEIEVTEKPWARTAQKQLANEVTTLVHGAAATQQVTDATTALFGGGNITTLDLDTLQAAIQGLPTGHGEPGITLTQALVATGLTPSLTRARQAINQGGVSVNNVKTTDVDAEITDFLHQKIAIIRLGKKNLAALTRAN